MTATAGPGGAICIVCTVGDVMRDASTEADAASFQSLIRLAVSIAKATMIATLPKRTVRLWNLSRVSVATVAFARVPAIDAATTACEPTAAQTEAVKADGAVCTEFAASVAAKTDTETPLPRRAKIRRSFSIA